MNPEQNGYRTEGDEFMTLPENLRRCLWMLAHERMRQDEKWGGPEHDDTHGRLCAARAGLRRLGARDERHGQRRQGPAAHAASGCVGAG